MSSEISQSDLLREWIEKEFDENKDFSKSSYKRKSIKEFVQNHPELKTDEKKVGKHFASILKEVATKKKKTPEEVGIKKPRINQSMINQASDMDAIITPKPQGAFIGAPQITQPQIQSQLTNPQNKGNHDEKAVSAALTAFYLILRTGFAPEAELLSDDEKDSLGKLGKPVFDRFFGENEDLVICFLGIGGVFAPKLSKGRKLKKEKQAKEKKEQEEKPLAS